MKELILAYQGEMTLKGLNRGKFEARLAKTIRWRLEPLGKFKVYQAQSTVFIEPKEDGLDMDEAFRRVSHVFGIVKLSRAVECPKDFAAICETAEAYLGETLRGIRTFKVEAKRADKTYPMKSPEICRELGAYLLDKHHHLRVDVHNPQLEIMVEIRDYAAYVHGPKVEAAGGLPSARAARAEPAVRRHRQPRRRVVHGPPRSGAAPHPFCQPAVHEPARQAESARSGPRAGRVHRQLHAVRRALHEAAGVYP